MLFSVWSGPRCCSTALMYSFGQRSDMIVYDEPLYAAYLMQTGTSRPYREQVLKSQSNDGESVMSVLSRQTKDKHVYAKQMGKFISCIQRRWLKEGVHFVLVREPLKVINSFSEVLETTLEETSYPALCRIVSELRALGKKPVVVLSEDLVSNPERMLRAMCERAGLDFDPAMLRWPAGPKPYDGVWASHWYRSVHASTGWGEPTSSHKPQAAIAPELKPMLHECYAMYDLLLPYVLKPASPAGRATAALAEQLSAAALHSPRLRHSVSLDGAAAAAEPPSGAPLEAAGEGNVHAFPADPRNADVLIGMRDGVTQRFVFQWRPAAKVSALDAGFLLGDGVWEGLRIHKGCILFIWAHLRRLYSSAKALKIDMDVTPRQLLGMLRRTMDVNGMREASGAHVRLVVSRGRKMTPTQDPRMTLGGPTIAIIPEWKEATPQQAQHGIRLVTVSIRRGRPDVQEPAWNSLSKLNCIAACIAATTAGGDEGLMLDPEGFVATCNSTNFFIIVCAPAARDAPFDPRTGGEEDLLEGASGLLRGAAADGVELWAPQLRHQMPGVTRANVLAVAADLGWVVREKDFTLTDVYGALEVFVCGTAPGVRPVTQVDGRRIGDGKLGVRTAEIQQGYAQMVAEYVRRASDDGGREPAIEHAL
eukprot:jgi/Ulvmu1/186/UM001_0190.1